MHLESRSGVVDVSQQMLDKYKEFIAQRRQDSSPAKVFGPALENAKEIAALLAAGGIVALPWGAKERRIFIIAGAHDLPSTPKLLNEAKGRPAKQTLAIGCLPESIGFFAKPENSLPLRKAAEKLQEENLTDVLNHCYNYSLGLLFEAQESLSPAITRVDGGRRTVLIMAANDWQDEYDIYNKTLWELSVRYGKAIAGTSANPSGSKAFSVYDQEEAYGKFQNIIDGFVKYKPLPERPKSKPFQTSCTMIDVTGEKPVAGRWGSVHPVRFREFFPDLIIPKNIARE